MNFFSKHFIVCSPLTPEQVRKKIATLLESKDGFHFFSAGKTYQGTLEKNEFRIKKNTHTGARMFCPPVVEGEIREEQGRTTVEVNLKLGMANLLGFLLGAFFLATAMIFAMTIGREFPLLMFIVSGVTLFYLVLNLISFKFQMVKEKNFFEEKFSNDI